MPGDKALCPCGCGLLLSRNQARNHLKGRRPIGIQAALYEQNPWLEKARNAVWKGKNRAKAKAISSSNASARAHHSRAIQSNIVHTSPHRNRATDEINTLGTGVAPDLPVGSSNALQRVIQVPNSGHALHFAENNHSGMEMDEMALPDASAASEALPARSSNAPQCVIQASNPGNALDSTESYPSEMQTEDDPSSGDNLSVYIAQIVQRRWAATSHNLKTVVEDGDEARDEPSIDGEEDVRAEEEADMWDLMRGTAPSEGIPLQDRMGEHFMREAGNSLVYE